MVTIESSVSWQKWMHVTSWQFPSKIANKNNEQRLKRFLFSLIRYLGFFSSSFFVRDYLCLSMYLMLLSSMIVYLYFRYEWGFHTKRQLVICNVYNWKQFNIEEIRYKPKQDIHTQAQKCACVSWSMSIEYSRRSCTLFSLPMHPTSRSQFSISFYFSLYYSTSTICLHSSFLFFMQIRKKKRNCQWLFDSFYLRKY